MPVFVHIELASQMDNLNLDPDPEVIHGSKTNL
jgi:hypothetical protein